MVAKMIASVKIKCETSSQNKGVFKHRCSSVLSWGQPVYIQILVKPQNVILFTHLQSTCVALTRAICVERPTTSHQEISNNIVIMKNLR